MEKKDSLEGMSMKERREKGLLWVDTGENMEQQIFARGLCREFNLTKPEQAEERAEIWKKLLLIPI